MTRLKNRAALDLDLEILENSLPSKIRQTIPSLLMDEFFAEGELILFHTAGQDKPYVRRRLQSLERLLRRVAEEQGSSR